MKTNFFKTIAKTRLIASLPLLRRGLGGGLFAVLLIALAMLVACSDDNKGKYQGDDSDNTEKPVPTIRYRGINISTDASFTKADAVRLGSWGVNHVRWPFDNWISESQFSKQTVDDYLEWIEESCDELEAVLPYLEEEGITVCITIIHPPRGGHQIFHVDDPDLQGAFIEGWKNIAERFKNSNVIVYYDILNEPDDSNPRPGLKGIRSLFTATVQAIQAIDNTKKFVFEQKWDEYKNLEPLPLDNIIYSVHVYRPHEVTHSGVIDANPVGPVYPGYIAGEYNEDWDKTTLRKYYLDAITFAKTNRVEMYVGEFGCARWAPNKSAYNYFRDCLELFEEGGWHYAFFQDFPWASWNYGANTWSLQYDEVYNSQTPLSEPTDRLVLLQTYWAKNGK